MKVNMGEGIVSFNTLNHSYLEAFRDSKLGEAPVYIAMSFVGDF